MCTEYLMMPCGVHVVKDELLNYCVDDVMYEYCAHYSTPSPSDLLERYRSNFLGRRICLPVRVIMVTGGVGGVGVAGVAGVVEVAIAEGVVGVIGRAVVAWGAVEVVVSK